MRKTATSELANPKIGREEARRLCLTSSPADMESFDSFPDYRLAESCQEWADTLLLTRGQRFRSRTSPDCQRKRLPVELPGTVALTGGCVFRGLLVQNRRVQTVQSGLFGAVSDSGLVVLLRAAACVSLVSSQGFSPPLRRGCGDRKELTYPFSPCFCAKHGQDLTPFAASCRELAP